MTARILIVDPESQPLFWIEPTPEKWKADRQPPSNAGAAAPEYGATPAAALSAVVHDEETKMAALAALNVLIARIYSTSS